MAVVDSPAHLLSLKVMRVSRSEVSGVWQPFFSSSPFFSAHASASILSLQGNAPLPGHPKTLRDLTHASDLLTLPSSFGTIQLGHTFSSCLCINNEAPFSIDSIHIRVEMQTATSKVPLFQTPELTGITLVPGDTLENLVSHEIKELGQHVLACTVTYRLPPNVRPIPGASEDPKDPSLQTFRKFYKFMVTNPLAVKTKVHPVQSPTALLTPSEREKIFLEVHIQNVTQETMHFERMSFEPTDEWQVQDPNLLDPDRQSSPQSIFSDSLSLMNPQDTRQYIFILAPISASSLRPLANPPPGSIIPLGRLNIAWRSSYGEPGRLLTSMLTRRVPLVSPAPPAPNTSQHSNQHPQRVSAVPPYLKRGSTTTPSRPQSPTTIMSSQAQSRPSTPPPRRPHSPAPHSHQPSPTAPPTLNISAHLTLRDSLPSVVKVNKPFTLKFTLHITTSVPPSMGSRLLFVVQHILPLSTDASNPSIELMVTSAMNGGLGTGYNTSRTIVSPSSTTLAQTLQSQLQSKPQSRSRSHSHSQLQAPEAASPRTSLSIFSSGFSTPTATSSRNAPTPGVFDYSLARQKLLDASSKQMHDTFGAEDGEDEGDTAIYPPPYPLHSNPSSPSKPQKVIPLGASSFSLPPLTLVSRNIPPHPPSMPLPATATPAPNLLPSIEPAEPQTQWYASHDFDFVYLSLRPGFSNVGGVRILYLGEDTIDELETEPGSLSADETGGRNVRGDKRKSHIVKEYDVVAEIWAS